MDRSTSTKKFMHLRRHLYGVFITYWFVLVVGLSSLKRADCAKEAVVSRLKDGDRFTNPFDTNGAADCKNITAHCDKDLLRKCSECVCNKGSENYRADIKKCVSTENLTSFTGCRYKGIKNALKGYMDTNLPILDFTKSDSKDFRGLLVIPARVMSSSITCQIENNTSFLDSRGHWTPLPNIGDVLLVRAYDGHAAGVQRYLALNWEGVDSIYFGLIIKLQIACHTTSDLTPETGCFVFKTKGQRNLDVMPTTVATVTTKNRISPKVHTYSSSVKFRKEKDFPSTGFTPTQSSASTTEGKSIVKKNYSYSVPLPVIIGVSAGVGVVILSIIIMAICCVRRKTRKYQESRPSIVNSEAPKVHFTAEARFSLIKEAAPVEVEDEDYTSLKDNRASSYRPYCSLEKDDVDLNVIDTVLKDAVSMESMNPLSEPRYSCHLTYDNTIVIESAGPHSPKQPKYHVLEAPDDVTEPDYEEVEDENNAMMSSHLLNAKPPLPIREYKKPSGVSGRLQSEC